MVQLGALLPPGADQSGGQDAQEALAKPPDAFDSRLTNGRVEAVNSLIQATKVRARGYGTTRHLITILYLVAGKLTRLPTSPFVVQSGLPITTWVRSLWPAIHTKRKGAENSVVNKRQ